MSFTTPKGTVIGKNVINLVSPGFWRFRCLVVKNFILIINEDRIYMENQNFIS